jgi:hypothetical protein
LCLPRSAGEHTTRTTSHYGCRSTPCDSPRAPSTTIRLRDQGWPTCIRQHSTRGPDVRNSRPPFYYLDFELAFLFFPLLLFTLSTRPTTARVPCLDPAPQSDTIQVHVIRVSSEPCAFRASQQRRGIPIRTALRPRKSGREGL